MQSKVILYIAQSIDGYIAALDGSVDFLSCVEDDGEDYGYFEFYRSMDAVIMGANTYEQILSFGEFPYPDKPCYVFTNRTYKEHDQVVFVSEEPTKWIKNCTILSNQRLWLVGGASLIKTFQDAELIDEYIISIIPCMLGDGIPLFKTHGYPLNLKMKNVQDYPSGLVQLVYERITDSPSESDT